MLKAIPANVIMAVVIVVDKVEPLAIDRAKALFALIRKRCRPHSALSQHGSLHGVDSTGRYHHGFKFWLMESLDTRPPNPLSGKIYNAVQ